MQSPAGPTARGFSINLAVYFIYSSYHNGVYFIYYEVLYLPNEVLYEQEQEQEHGCEYGQEQADGMTGGGEPPPPSSANGRKRFPC